MRAVGDDPERDKCARFRGVEAVLDGPSESFRIGDHVVGRDEQHERVGISPRGGQCGNACRGCGVPATRLEDHRAGPRGDLLQLLGNQKAVPMIGEDGDLAE